MAVEDSEGFLNTLEGEIAFFRSLMRARPIGNHRHFHTLVIRSAIQRDTGRWVPMDEIWEKLRTCYDIDMLESIVNGFDIPGSNPAGPAGASVRSPSPIENLASHPYFKTEFTLPDDPIIEDIISRRRMRASVSTISAAPSPTFEKPVTATHPSRRARNKNKMAGLVGGDSDSSALTQESGDESVSPTPVTATDGATDYADGDGEQDQPAETASSSKQSRKGQKPAQRNSNAMTTRAKGPPPTSRGVKKKKR
ncbi:hypothetical protein BC835DRAFT_1343999 [Cytidiella melzeri]|nr:hypothetical protein BC835DRAFT_1343999 [Cytidiella melzeri]